MTDNLLAELDRIEALANAATPGEWKPFHHEKLGHWVQTQERIRKNDPGKFPPDFAEQILAGEDYPDKPGDCDFIADARTSNPRMVRMIRAQERALKASGEYLASVLSGKPRHDLEICLRAANSSLDELLKKDWP